jgi:hypothetical protein
MFEFLNRLPAKIAAPEPDTSLGSCQGAVHKEVRIGLERAVYARYCLPVAAVEATHCVVAELKASIAPFADRLASD